MRWQTADPLGFEDGLNLYSYVHNNPFFYRDSDGRFAFAFAIPIIEIAFGGAIEAVVFPSLAKVAITAIVAVGAYQAGQYIGGKVNDDQMHMENIKEAAERDADGGGGFRKKAPPRTEPRDLEEQLTLEEAKHNPGDELEKIKIKDPKYPVEDWKKKAYEHERLDGTKTKQIHYWEDVHTGERHGFKFKDDPN